MFMYGGKVPSKPHHFGICSGITVAPAIRPADPPSRRGPIIPGSERLGNTCAAGYNSDPYVLWMTARRSAERTAPKISGSARESTAVTPGDVGGNPDLTSEGLHGGILATPYEESISDWLVKLKVIWATEKLSPQILTDALLEVGQDYTGRSPGRFRRPERRAVKTVLYLLAVRHTARQISYRVHCVCLRCSFNTSTACEQETEANLAGLRSRPTEEGQREDLTIITTEDSEQLPMFHSEKTMQNVTVSIHGNYRETADFRWEITPTSAA
ncbi:hypothetical protein Bbelb_233340 [Branchiostoma belcheri]|nr:hypothetical protein Bbelb_233340 [Branchiostoma belcheri]